MENGFAFPGGEGENSFEGLRPSPTRRAEEDAASDGWPAIESGESRGERRIEATIPVLHRCEGPGHCPSGNPSAPPFLTRKGEQI